MIITRTEQVTSSRAGADELLTRIAALDLIQDCDCVGMDYDEQFNICLEANDLAAFLVSRQVKFLTTPSYRERLVVRTMPYTCNIHFANRYTEIVTEVGETVAYAHTIAVYVNRTTLKAGRIPREVAESVEVHEPPRQPFGSRHINVDRTLPGGVATLPVLRRDIDRNNHVNNVRYIEKASEILPEGFKYDALRVDYKASAMAGDTLIAERHGDGRVQYVTFSAPDGKIYTVIEFTTI